jgi:hypothetical protein
MMTGHAVLASLSSDTQSQTLLLTVLKKVTSEAKSVGLSSGGNHSLGVSEGPPGWDYRPRTKMPALSEVFWGRAPAEVAWLRPLSPGRPFDKAYHGACRLPGYSLHPFSSRPSPQAETQLLPRGTPNQHP